MRSPVAAMKASGATILLGASRPLAEAEREAQEAEQTVERTHKRLASYLRVRTEVLGADELTTPGESSVSLFKTVATASRAFCDAPLGWLWFAVCFLPRAVVLACAYLCADGDGRMRAIRGMLSATSAHVPRNLVALQRVTDIAQHLPMLSWVQVSLFGGGGVSTCPASAVAGNGEWLWPTPPLDASGRERGGLGAPARPPALEPPFAERRLVLYIHGGAFVLCNPATHRSLTANLARHLRCAVLATKYRRAPQHAYAEALDSLLDLYRTLLASFPAHGLILAGESAGANLALSLCLRASQLGLPAPAGLILVSPWADLSDTTSDSWERCRHTDYLPPDLARMFASAYAGDVPLRDERISPLYAAGFAGSPRTLVVYGGGECLSSQQGALVRRMREARVPTSTFVCPDGMHGFPLFADAAYWGWNRRGARPPRGRHGSGRASSALIEAQHDSAPPRAAGSSNGAGASAGFLEGTDIDALAQPEVPGALQSFFAMRDFAHAAWGASCPPAEHKDSAPEPIVDGARDGSPAA